MLKRFYDTAFYQVFVLSPDLEAYRTDRFKGWLRQPADVGPVIFSNSSPTYANLTPVASTSSGGGGTSTGAIVGVVVVALVALALALWFVRRRRTAEERE